MPEPGDAGMPLSAGQAGDAHAAHSPRTLHRLRQLSARHPEGWMIPVSGVAWALLASPSVHAGGGAYGALAAMVVAMMLPLTIGRARQIARATRPGRRHCAAAAFVVGYLAAWVPAMFAIDAGLRLLDLAAGATAAAGVALAAAVAWEVTPRKWRRWRGRPQAVPPAPAAGHADNRSARLGATAARGCVGSCWALMAACAVFPHTPGVMAAFFVLQLLGTHRRPVSPPVMALAVLAVCAASLVLTAEVPHHHPGS